ncbi:transcriptional regulator of pyridoxine metabolism [Klebsiella pneumoniae]|uniref:Transcriptional regulator of pyridoxine metabolism n=1 Tax=Klebsiella pneumoniae TaxID=573 RepID=A0A378BLJ9_KLEPN|nr:transcriptional regulator of pyridoxine metabolism [Klebsiella pneumoniae]
MLAGKTASEIFDNIRHLVQSGGCSPERFCRRYVNSPASLQ